MKKISTILLASLCLLLHYSVCAQSKLKAEKEFLTQLNTILKKSKQQHWKYKGTMNIDSAFAINKEGILSVTVHYTDEDSSVVRMRMEAPANKILLVAYDLYLILEYKEDEVTVYESEVNSKELKKLHNTNLFHIGAPLSNGYNQREKLQKLLEKMLK
jgi:hypothetical protein